MSGGLPHSEIHGSRPVHGSPWLIAVYHVLHRLLLPRHPPNALFALDPIRKEQGCIRRAPLARCAPQPGRRGLLPSPPRFPVRSFRTFPAPGEPGSVRHPEGRRWSVYQTWNSLVSAWTCSCLPIPGWLFRTWKNRHETDVYLSQRCQTRPRDMLSGGASERTIERPARGVSMIRSSLAADAGHHGGSRRT